mgnify:CR=1 FL=1
MRLTQLQYFMAVYEHQNITKAAEKLHISQPSITIALKELENEYHVNLFHRINKKMYLTEEGQIFYRYASAILKNVQDLDNSMQDLTGNRNMIKLGMPLQIGAFLLPLLCKDFKTAYPKINLSLVECGAMDIVDKLLREELDIAVACIEAQSTVLDLIPLFETEICFCVHKSHPLASRSSISFEESCTYSVTMVPEGAYTYKRIWSVADKKGVHPKVELYSLQLYTILNLIRLADMGSYLIKEAVAHTPDIVAIPFEDPLPVTASTLTKKGQLLYTDSKALISFIREKYRIHSDKNF